MQQQSYSFDEKKADQLGAIADFKDAIGDNYISDNEVQSFLKLGSLYDAYACYFLKRFGKLSVKVFLFCNKLQTPISVHICYSDLCDKLFEAALTSISNLDLNSYSFDLRTRGGKQIQSNKMIGFYNLIENDSIEILLG